MNILYGQMIFSSGQIPCGARTCIYFNGMLIILHNLLEAITVPQILIKLNTFMILLNFSKFNGLINHSFQRFILAWAFKLKYFTEFSNCFSILRNCSVYLRSMYALPSAITFSFMMIFFSSFGHFPDFKCVRKVLESSFNH